MSSSEQSGKVFRGIVKQVLSGDSIIIREQPKGGPPPEMNLCLSNVTAPKLARRANPNIEGAQETTDEPFAWEAREFLRKKLIGKEITFIEEYSPPSAGRKYGFVFVGRDPTVDENITESIVAEGLVEVRRAGIRATDEKQQRLVQLEDAAKEAGKGKWATGTGSTNVRNVVWNLENPRFFVDLFKGKPVDAIIEHVRDGCTVRAFVLPSFHYITVMLSGIKCPMFNNRNNESKPDEFAEEAKFFTESRLLQREVQIVLEGVSNQNLLGTVLHPNGNIAEILLKEGFARCVDWSMGVIANADVREKLRAAEKLARDNKKRVWKDYKPSAAAIEVKDKSFTAKVVEVVNGDALVVKQDTGFKKIFLASVRPPRMSDTPDAEKKESGKQGRTRPLYDVPYMFEAREFLRKKLIGKKVQVQVDYIQPASQGYPEKTCCTVSIRGLNVAEALISKGLASVIRYRQGDDSRSSSYDSLLAAEEKAKKYLVGIHSKKEPPIHRVADISGDVAKAKQFLPFLQRAGRSTGIVEFVASGSRLRIFISRETCLITLLLSGINCSRSSRPGAGGVTVPGEPFGEEAMLFTKEQCLQREVEVEIEDMDKGGNFIGWLYVDNLNLSVALVEEGLASVHFTAERSSNYKPLKVAEDNAKKRKSNLWATYEEPKEEVVKEEPGERKVNYKPVVITEVTDTGHFYIQHVDNGPALEEMMEKLRSDLEVNPPLAGAYTPKKGDICASKFMDGLWYRARIEKVTTNTVHVLYIDYGNREVTNSSQLANLPPSFKSLPAQAQECALACVQLPPDEEAMKDGVDAIQHDIINKQLMMNVEYKVGNLEHVSLVTTDSKEDIGQALIADGILLVENRREKRLAKMVSEYTKAQEKAKSARMNLWRYGDFREDEAREFGFK
ncbi:staphylococcal nuclease domain-containing protein 1-like [Tubulanus polymorphus]|uniref:staphylococcal nuclease domain-containing protein 1-like n=1 Tax=Tubulanus polymorphus TaxID=672921 RepID=UPI003DA5F1F1